MLAARLALSFLLPTLALLLVVGFLAERVAQRTFEDQLSERLVDISLATRNQFSNKYYQRPKTWTALDASKPVMMEKIPSLIVIFGMTTRALMKTRTDLSITLTSYGAQQIIKISTHKR